VKATSLPEGWTGNRAHHHLQVSIFQVEVHRTPARRFRWRVTTLSRVLVVEGDPHGYPDPEEARRAALFRLAEVAEEVTRAVLGACFPHEVAHG
jgi:hypothetical protein